MNSENQTLEQGVRSFPAVIKIELHIHMGTETQGTCSRCKKEKVVIQVHNEKTEGAQPFCPSCRYTADVCGGARDCYKKVVPGSCLCPTHLLDYLRRVGVPEEKLQACITLN